MTNFVQIIKQCEAAEGGGSKKVIQAVLSMADQDARDLIAAALDPYRTYGVRQYEMPTSYQKPGYAGINQFFDLLQALSSRSLTGDAARLAVTRTLALYDQETAEFLTRVLEKDLRAGFSAETANKMWANKIIPTFEVMLADKCEEPEEFLERLTFPAQADWKYDGQRTICIVRAGQPVEYRARSGKPMDHLVGTYDEDLSNIRAACGYDFVMDGESFASDFTETINAKKEGNQAAKDALRLRAFFMMPLTDWMNQKTSITMRQNRIELTKRIELSACKRIEISKGREVKDYADMVAYCNEVIDVHKQEGLIIKNWDATYQWDRTIDWCKVKRMWDVDGKIVGFYPGRKKSRLENTLGGITVRGTDEHGTPFEVNVGSGFTDEMRAEIWNNRDKYFDATCTVQYQEMCKAKGSDVMSLRFPVFMHLRDDK